MDAANHQQYMSQKQTCVTGMHRFRYAMVILALSHVMTVIQKIDRCNMFFVLSFSMREMFVFL
jgi:hypothetical protein